MHTIDALALHSFGMSSFWKDTIVGHGLIGPGIKQWMQWSIIFDALNEASSHDAIRMKTQLLCNISECFKSNVVIS